MILVFKTFTDNNFSVTLAAFQKNSKTVGFSASDLK